MVHHQYVENVKKRAYDEGTTLGSNDEIILDENDLPTVEILYNIIYLKYKIYYI